MDGRLDTLLVGLFGGLANLFVDIPALWNYDWSQGIPGYQDLVRSPHRYLNTPLFTLLVSYVVWIGLTAFVHGYLNRDGRRIYGP